MADCVACGNGPLIESAFESGSNVGMVFKHVGFPGSTLFPVDRARLCLSCGHVELLMSEKVRNRLAQRMEHLRPSDGET